MHAWKPVDYLEPLFGPVRLGGLQAQHEATRNYLRAFDDS